MKNRSNFSECIRLIKESNETGNFLKLFVIYCFMAICNIISANGIGKAIENIIDLKIITFYYGLVLIAISITIYNLLNYISKLIKCNAKERILSGYRIKSAKAIINSEYADSQSNRLGDILGRMQEDVKNTSYMVSDMFPNFIKSIVVVFTVFLVLLYNNIILGAIFVLIIPVMTLVQAWGQKYCDRSMDKVRSCKNDKNAVIQDVLSNRQSVKFYQAETKVLYWTKQKIRNYIKAFTKSMIDMTAYFSPAIILIRVPVLLVCGISGFLISKGELSLANFLMLLTISMYGTKEISGIGQIMTNIPNLLSYSRRLFEIWDAPQFVNGSECTEKSETPLRYENVSFSYNPGGNLAINNVSFNIVKNSFVAIVGPSGCGKSTLLKLAAGLYTPQNGTISAWGTSITDWNSRLFYKKIGYATQEVYLFPSTIRENIQLNRDKESDISEIITLLRLDELISSLDDGLDSIIEEKGVNFSGGQKQRIALARTLNWNPKLLLLDEITSALDKKTEQEILKQLKSKYINTTIIITAHRLDSIKDANRIIVMNEGKIVEMGTHEELIHCNGLYKKMFDEQTGVQE